MQRSSQEHEMSGEQWRASAHEVATFAGPLLALGEGEFLIDEIGLLVSRAHEADQREARIAAHRALWVRAAARKPWRVGRAVGRG